MNIRSLSIAIREVEKSLANMETRWLYVTSEELEELREKAQGACVIPIGCVEKHGLHLPLGTDMIQAENIVYQASLRETVCVFPNFTFGDIGECTPHTPVGTISIPVETQFLLMKQLCEQITRNGFDKIIIFNGHGGNRPWLSMFLKEYEKYHENRYELYIVNIHCDVMKRIAKAKALRGLTIEDKQLAAECREAKVKDGHAGYSETAYIMATNPECVKMERLGVLSGACTGYYAKYKEMGIQLRDEGWEIDYPNWIDSVEPIGCNERIGKAALRLEAERVAGIFRRIKQGTYK